MATESSTAAIDVQGWAQAQANLPKFGDPNRAARRIALFASEFNSFSTLEMSHLIFQHKVWTSRPESDR